MPPIPNFDNEMTQNQKLNLLPSGYETEVANYDQSAALTNENYLIKNTNLG